MSTRAVELAVPAPLRWLGAIAVCAAAFTAMARLREKPRQPKIAPMSGEWLQRHAADREYYSHV